MTPVVIRLKNQSIGDRVHDINIEKVLKAQGRVTRERQAENTRGQNKNETEKEASRKI